jgi:hypothetical protein
MADKKNEIAISEQHQLVSKEINEQVLSVISNHADGFQKAFVMATALQKIKELLTPEVMKPIMALQGSKLGFKTDRDVVKNRTTGKYEKGPGYPIEVVTECVTEAILLGLEVTNNQMNIIGGNMYPTREGFGGLLDKINGLRYNITYPSVSQSPDKQSANVIAKIEWSLGNESKKQEIDFPIKSDTYTTLDALIGKAERKAKRWLFNHIRGTDISDGDVTEIPHTEVSSTVSQVTKNKQENRVLNHIENATDIKTLAKCRKAIDENDKDTMDIYIAKYISLCETMKELELAKNQFTTDDHELVIAYDDKERELKNG